MPKTYDQAPDEVRDRVIALIKKFHPDLEKVELRVDLLMASTDSDAPAVSVAGYHCFACIKILGPKERAMDRGDAEITIDRDAYEAMTGEERDALLDHELYHLALVRDGEGKPKRDDYQRPKLRLRKHDVQFGWFAEIARRHGQHSQEVQQAAIIFKEGEQLYFGYAQELAREAQIERALSPAGKAAVGGLSYSVKTGDRKITIDKDGINSAAA